MNEELLQSHIQQAEYLLEGLPKSFWYLVKLTEPQIWENIDDDPSATEYVHVIALFGQWCIFFDETVEAEGFRIANYEDHGALAEVVTEIMPLHDVIATLVDARFKL